MPLVPLAQMEQQVRKEYKEIRARLVLQVPTDRQVHKVLKVSQGRQVPLVQLALMEQQVHKALKGSQVRLEPPVPPELQVQWELQERKALRVVPVPQE